MTDESPNLPQGIDFFTEGRKPQEMVESMGFENTTYILARIIEIYNLYWTRPIGDLLPNSHIKARAEIVELFRRANIDQTAEEIEVFMLQMFQVIELDILLPSEPLTYGIANYIPALLKIIVPGDRVLHFHPWPGFGVSILAKWGKGHGFEYNAVSAPDASESVVIYEFLDRPGEINSLDIDPINELRQLFPNAKEFILLEVQPKLIEKVKRSANALSYEIQEVLNPDVFATPAEMKAWVESLEIDPNKPPIAINNRINPFYKSGSILIITPKRGE